MKINIVEIDKIYLSEISETKTMKFTKNQIIYTSIIFLVLILVGFFAYQYIAPFGGKIIYQFSAEKDKDKLSSLNGAVASENINNNANSTLTIPQQIIRSNIVTFNLKLLSKKIDGVWVNLKFKGDPKEIKMGVKGGLKEQYLYKPLYNSQIENLKDVKYDSNQILFWQKNNIYTNLNGFIQKPPTNKQTALYFIDYTELSKLKVKSTSNLNRSQIVINKPLRGSHTIFVKINNGQLNLILEKRDGNMYKGPDVLLIDIYKSDKKIFTKEIPDDGIEDPSGLKLATQKETINIKNIDNGIYKINLLDKSVGSDISIKSIVINQAELVFLPPIYITDDKPTRLWTDSNTINLRVVHEESVQTVKIDNKNDLLVKDTIQPILYNLNENKEGSSSASQSTIHILDFPKNDIIIKGDGYFSFTKEAFFDPDPFRAIDLYKLKNITEVDYIIANYQKVKKDGDWNVAQVYFDPKDIKIDGDKLYFSLESPELKDFGGEYTIDNLEVTVNKPGWFGGAVQKNEEQTAGAINGQPNGVVAFFQGIWNKILSFLPGQAPVEEIEATPTSTPLSVVKVTLSVTPTPTKKITPSVTPTPTTDPRVKIPIKVQNGGAGQGSATRFSSVLKLAGYTNVQSGNAANFDNKNATVIYNGKGNVDQIYIDEIKNLLKKDYTVVNGDATATDKDIVTIILGENPNSPTTTPTPTVKK